jgi:hypothetical protein
MKKYLVHINYSDLIEAKDEEDALEKATRIFIGGSVKMSEIEAHAELWEEEE